MVVLFSSTLEQRSKPSYFDCYHGIKIPCASVMMEVFSNVAVHFVTADTLQGIFSCFTLAFDIVRLQTAGSSIKKRQLFWLVSVHEGSVCHSGFKVFLL